MVTIRGLFRTQISEIIFFFGKDLAEPCLAYVLNKITLTTENMSTVLHILFLVDMSIFNDLVIKDDPAKKFLSQTPSLFLRRGFNCITTKFRY